MNGNKHYWLRIRLASLIVVAILTKAIPYSPNGDFSQPNWSFFFILIGLIAFGIVFVMQIQSINPLLSRSVFQRPSWHSNPFIFGEPLVTFDFASYIMLVVGIVNAFSGLTTNPQSWFWEIPLSAGIGLWLGVRLCVAIYCE